jgi:hypothetical protein
VAYYGYKPAEQAIQIGDNTIVSADITDGSIVNADLNASAAIAMSKTQFVAGTGLTLSTNTVNVDAAQTQITSVGTITTGVWNAGAVTSSGSIKGSATGAGRILNETASATNPTLNPRNDESSTGIGGVGSSLYIISNGTTNSTYSGTTATFAGAVVLPSNEGVQFGDSAEVIYGTGSDLIAQSSANIYIKTNGSTTALTLDTGQDATFAGKVLGVNGSVTAPSFSWDSDKNTGMYRTQADHIGFTTAGVKRTEIASDGGLYHYGLSSFTGNATFAGDISMTGDGKKMTLANGYNTVSSMLRIANRSTVVPTWSDANVIEIHGAGSGSNSEVLMYLKQHEVEATRPIIQCHNGTPAMVFEVGSTGYVTTPTQPSFSAYRSSSTSYSVNTDLVFNAEKYDVGGNYNTSNGIFCAPVAGVYLFTATILADSSGAGYEYDCVLKSSRGNVNSHYFGNPGRTEYQDGTSWGDGYIALGISQIVKLEAGEDISCSFTTFGGGSIYGDSNGQWTRFSGHLLG